MTRKAMAPKFQTIYNLKGGGGEWYDTTFIVARRQYRNSKMWKTMSPKEILNNTRAARIDLHQRGDLGPIEDRRVDFDTILCLQL